jgi:hypothetical protein
MSHNRPLFVDVLSNFETRNTQHHIIMMMLSWICGHPYVSTLTMISYHQGEDPAIAEGALLKIPNTMTITTCSPSSTLVRFCESLSRQIYSLEVALFLFAPFAPFSSLSFLFNHTLPISTSIFSHLIASSKSA